MILLALLAFQTTSIATNLRLPVIPPAIPQDVISFEQRLGVSVGAGAELMSKCPWSTDTSAGEDIFCVRHLGGIDGRIDQYTDEIVAAGWKWLVSLPEADRPSNYFCKDSESLQVSAYTAYDGLSWALADLSEVDSEAAIYFLNSHPIMFTFEDRECPQ